MSARCPSVQTASCREIRRLRAVGRSVLPQAAALRRCVTSSGTGRSLEFALPAPADWPSSSRDPICAAPHCEPSPAFRSSTFSCSLRCCAAVAFSRPPRCRRRRSLGPGRFRIWERPRGQCPPETSPDTNSVTMWRRTSTPRIAQAAEPPDSAHLRMPIATWTAQSLVAPWC